MSDWSTKVLDTVARSLGCGFVLVLVMATAPAALAQPGGEDQLERFQRQLEQIERQTRLEVNVDVPVGQRTLVDAGGTFSFNFIALDDLDGHTRILRQTDLTGYGLINVDGVHEVFLRARSTYRDFNEGDAFDVHGDDWVEPTLDRGYYRFDFGRARSAYGGEPVDFGLQVQAGRQLVHWANGLVLSQVLDGGVLRYTKDQLGVQLLAGTTRPSTNDFDSSRPDFDGDTHRAFYGALLTFDASPQHQPFVYGLYQQDNNDEDQVTLFDPNAGLVTAEFEYNSYYIGFGSRGSLTDKLIYSVEAAYEGGEGFSTPITTGNQFVDQTEETISAFALDAQLDYLVGDANRTRYSAEFLLATGDGDRFVATSATLGGNRPGTRDNAFNAFGLINTGLAFAPDASNLIMLRGGTSFYPLPGHERFDRLQVGADLFVYSKYSSGAPIEEASEDDGFFLGIEPDFFVNWQITSDLSMAARYGVFFPGDALEADNARHFFFTGLTLAF